jgi:hypothetical protein
MPVPKRKELEASTLVEVAEIEILELTFRLIGDTPVIFNRTSEKAKRQLLWPDPTKNKANREQTMKHNPIEEFRASPYRNRNLKEPTLLHLPGGMFKKCISQAAIDIPGASRAQVGRLVSLISTQINVYGIPHMRADMVRMAGPGRTPDIRFRACLPEWCCEVTYSYIASAISPTAIANLLSAAGVIVGIGDYRVEKGAGDYGKFRIAHPDRDTKEWDRIVAEGGRLAQESAMEIPHFIDDETAELVGWFDAEVVRRQRVPGVAVAGKARRKDGGEELPQ